MVSRIEGRSDRSGDPGNDATQADSVRSDSDNRGLRVCAWPVRQATTLRTGRSFRNSNPGPASMWPIGTMATSIRSSSNAAIRSGRLP